MKIDTIFAIATVFMLSHATPAQKNTEKLRQLLTAASQDFEQMQQLLADETDPADPNTQGTGNGLTALHFATAIKDINWINSLYETGANPNPLSSEGIAPLHLAAFAGDVALIVELAKCGANPDVRGAAGGTPLFLASSKGHIAAMDALVANGASVNAVNKNGLTALHIAAANGWLTSIAELIRLRAHINPTFDVDDVRDVTPLFMALELGQAAAAALLITYGAGVYSAPLIHRALLDVVKPFFQARGLPERLRTAFDYAVETKNGALAAAIFHGQLQDQEALLDISQNYGRLDVLQLVLAEVQGF